MNRPEEAIPIETPDAGDELAPGVTVERRHFISAGVAAVLLSAISTRPAGASNLTIPQETSAKDSGRLTWEQFLAEGVPLAKRIYTAAPDDYDAYLYSLASLASRLSDVPPTKLYAFGGLQPAVMFAPSFRGSPFVIIQWRMEPNAILPAHNHPNYSVCTVGVEGQARLRNFEVVGEAPEFTSQKTFLIRETHSQLMAANRVATLSPVRDNIHRFEAGSEGARGIDITTLYGKDVGFSFIEMDRNPKDARQGIFEASWIGMNPK